MLLVRFAPVECSPSMDDPARPQSLRSARSRPASSGRASTMHILTRFQLLPHPWTARAGSAACSARKDDGLSGPRKTAIRQGYCSTDKCTGWRTSARIARRAVPEIQSATGHQHCWGRAATGLLATDPLSALASTVGPLRHDRYDPFCDLERRNIVTLLPDREIATFKAWLADHPEIVIVARSRVERMGKCVRHSDQGDRVPHGPSLSGPSKCPITFGRIPLGKKSPA